MKSTSACSPPPANRVSTPPRLPNRDRPRTAHTNGTVSTADRGLAAASAALTLIFASAPLYAQERSESSELDDLIPDAAVENPEAWALETESASLEPLPAEEAEDPIAELSLPDEPIILNEPGDLVFEPLDPVEPDEDVRFADLQTDAPLNDFSNAETVAINDELVLGFPQREPPFTEQGEFLSRFEALSTIEELESEADSIALLAARSRKDEQLLNTLLRIYGYYDAQVIRSVGGEREPAAGESAARVRFDILPGARYRFGAVDLGSLSQAPDASQLRSAFEVRPGDYLSSDKVVEERYDLDLALGELGYAFAEIDEPTLLVDHARQEGDLTLPVRPNGKYVFGDTVSSMPEFLSGRHLATIARYDAGNVYQRSLELDLRRAVIATGLVSEVSIVPREVQAPVGDTPGVVEMGVQLTPAPLRTIAGAIGYGSEEGFRIQASWEHRNLFPPEGALRIRGTLGTREQLAGITFRRNNFGNRDRILTVDAFASTIDSDAFDANTVSAIVTYERASTLLFQKPISYSLGLELVATDERPAPIDGVTPPRETFFVAAIPAYGLIDQTDDLLDPTTGFRLGGRISPEISQSQGTTSFYARSQIDASYYRQVGERVVFAARTRLGAIAGTSLANIAPSRRFYAGGGSSVRGYGYQQIGPSNGFGEPNGGRSLVELSVEARIRTPLFDNSVSIVPFVDAGAVGPKEFPQFDNVKFGAGVGLRYYTGFGPLRVDVGVPINPDPDDGPVAVYVSLGQAF